MRPPFCPFPPDLTAKEYEELVYRQLASLGKNLRDFRVAHSERLRGLSGEYEFDVTARFTALGMAEFVVLVECKHWKKPVGRDVVEVLVSRLADVGGHKGMIFTTSDFQSGAVRFAQDHGIATVILADGRAAWLTRSQNGRPERPQWSEEPLVAAWLSSYDEEQKLHFSVVSYSHPEYLRRSLFGDET